MSDKKALQILVGLRAEALKEIERKRHQLEGFDMAIKLLADMDDWSTGNSSKPRKP